MSTSPPADSPQNASYSPLHQFTYEAQSPLGQTLRGTLEATHVTAATSQLQSLGLRVLSIAPAPDTAAPKRLSTDDFILFNQQLAHLTQAGLPVERGLRLIAADMQSGRLATAANAVAADLEKGASLREAFDRHANQFPSLYARLIDAGVQTGNLPGMLFSLGRHLELINRVRLALWQVFAYPLMTFAALSVVVLFISMRILPQFRDMYGDFNTTLPALTLFVLWVGQFYPWFLLAMALIAVAILITLALLRQAGKWGHVTDYLLLNIPIVGPVLKASLLARWCDALRLGISAGLDLPRAITLASDATASPKLQRDATSLIAMISSGQRFDGFYGYLLPPTIPAAIELSTQTGDLASTLNIITQMYQQQAEHRLRLIPVILTPILMVLIASGIGFTITALFLPLIKLISSLSGGG